MLEAETTYAQLKEKRDKGVLLNEVIVFNSLALASGLVKLGDKQVKNNRRHRKSQAQESISQLCGVNLATAVTIKPIKDALQNVIR